MKRIAFMLMILSAVVILLFGGALYAVYRAEMQTRLQSIPPRADVALVLGNAVNRRGKPNPCLQSRVDAGVWLYRSGLAQRLLMSGGTDGDGANEAETMRQMALEQGVPSEKILVENRSESTFENIVFSAPLLHDAPRVIIVSDGFHLARARWLAERHWPDGKEIALSASGSCGDTEANLWRKRSREVLAWIKALALHR